jgi:hypothetical protein
MKIDRLVWFALLALPNQAWAQADEEGGGEEAPAAEAAAAEPQAGEVDPTRPDLAAAPDEQPFLIRRGFFAETDLGVFFTFGGYNTNESTTNPPFPKKTLSNVQPYLGVVFGYDLLHSPQYSLSAGLKLSAGYSGGAGRVSDAELQANDAVRTVATKSADFSVIEVGAALSFGYHVTDRVALTFKGDGGLAAVDPNPALAASEAGAASAAFAPTFGVGAGVEYFTLLNDFSVGLDLRFAMVLVTNATIPGASISVPVKYTF